MPKLCLSLQEKGADSPLALHPFWSSWQGNTFFQIFPHNHYFFNKLYRTLITAINPYYFPIKSMNFDLIIPSPFWPYDSPSKIFFELWPYRFPNGDRPQENHQSTRTCPPPRGHSLRSTSPPSSCCESSLKKEKRNHNHIHMTVDCSHCQSLIKIKV